VFVVAPCAHDIGTRDNERDRAAMPQAKKNGTLVLFPKNTSLSALFEMAHAVVMRENRNSYPTGWDQ
jgi:hypothetical protein